MSRELFTLQDLEKLVIKLQNNQEDIYIEESLSLYFKEPIYADTYCNGVIVYADRDLALILDVINEDLKLSRHEFNIYGYKIFLTRDKSMYYLCRKH